MEVTLYIAASLDGYIARKDGSIDWLSMVDAEGEDYGYAEFYAGVDAVVMGRKTYELCLSFDAWPYPGKPAFVFTTRHLKSERPEVRFVSGDASSVLKMIDAQGVRRLWLVGGGELVRSFSRFVDEYIISFIPVLLGEGRPLFPPPAPEQRLRLVSSRAYPSGLVQMQYRRV